MKNITELELLAILENLRIIHPDDDYILRVASSIVAEYFGYCNRHTWCELLDEMELVRYGMQESQGHAKEQYKALCEKLKG